MLTELSSTHTPNQKSFRRTNTTTELHFLEIYLMDVSRSLCKLLVGHQIEQIAHRIDTFV